MRLYEVILNYDVILSQVWETCIYTHTQHTQCVMSLLCMNCYGGIHGCEPCTTAIVVHVFPTEWACHDKSGQSLLRRLIVREAG